jgi:hypothetical protein
MSQHLRLMAKRDNVRLDITNKQQQETKKQQQLIDELQQAHESLKYHVMPVDEIIVLQVKYDELTGKAPFVPKFPSWPTRLYSEQRVVRGYRVRLFVQTNDDRPECNDYGVYLNVQGGPFPCKVQRTFELVHHGWNPASTIRWTRTKEYVVTCNRGAPNFISKARLASPDNNPYVYDGYVTFKCTFKFV